MGFCANTSCGQAFIKNKALREMNKKGIYTPEQIDDKVDKYWIKYNPDMTTLIKKDQCTEIIQACVNDLGKIGDGMQYDEAKFLKVYKKFDAWGSQKIQKAMVVGMLTQLVTDNAKAKEKTQG